MKIRILMAALLLGTACSAADAALIVNWDGSGNDIVMDNNQNITQNLTYDETGGFQSPAQGPDYYPASANDGTETPDFFAAVSAGIDGTYRIFNGGGNDLIARIQVNGTTAGQFDSMQAWDTSGSGTLTDISIDRFSDFGAGVDSDQTSYRMIIQTSDNAWHATDALTAGTNSVDPAAASWNSFTPHIAGDETIGGPSAPNLFGVQRVGYFQTFTTTGGGGVFAVGFNASADPVPEPSTALLAVFGLSLCVSRRSRR